MLYEVGAVSLGVRAQELNGPQRTASDVTCWRPQCRGIASLACYKRVCTEIIKFFFFYFI